MTFHRLAISGGPTYKSTHLFLDGKPLRGVTGFTLTQASNDAMRLELSLIVEMDTVVADVEVEPESHLNLENLA